MSYGRHPYYIYSDGENMNFDFTRVPERIVNAWLYKILLSNRRDDLKERLAEGRAVWREAHEGDTSYQAWMDEQEDGITRHLLGWPEDVSDER
jgi:hypothetical protein